VNKHTPIFMGHGDADEVVPHSNGKRAYELLKQHGHEAITFRTYPGMPHSVSPLELEDLTSYLTTVLPPLA
jgi:predicted esterase